MADLSDSPSEHVPLSLELRLDSLREAPAARDLLEHLSDALALEGSARRIVTAVA